MLKNGKWNFQIQIVFEIKLELVDPLITDDVKKGELHIPSFQNRDDENIYSLQDYNIMKQQGKLCWMTILNNFKQQLI